MALVKAYAAATIFTKINPDIRLYLLGGEGEGQCRHLRDTLVASLGADAEAIDLKGDVLRADPARLSDEAAAVSMFGGPRWISIHLTSGSGEEILPAVEALLSAPAAGNPVVAIVAGLTARSKLTQLAEKSAAAIAVICYAPEARDGARLVEQFADNAGLQLARELPAMISESAGHDPAIIAQEVERLALYLDASPQQQKRADIAEWQAIAPARGDEDMGDAIDIILGGRLNLLPDTLARLENGGMLGINMVRMLALRIQTLARLRVAVDAGQSADAVVRAPSSGIFFKAQGAVAGQLMRWNGERLARALVALHGVERQLKDTRQPGELLLRHALLALTQSAAQAAAQMGRRRER